MHVYTGESQGRASTQPTVCDSNEIPAPQVTTASSHSLSTHASWHIYMHQIVPLQLRRMDIRTSDPLQSLPVKTQTFYSTSQWPPELSEQPWPCTSSPTGLTSSPQKAGPVSSWGERERERETLLNCCIKKVAARIKQDWRSLKSKLANEPYAGELETWNCCSYSFTIHEQ